MLVADPTSCNAQNRDEHSQTRESDRVRDVESRGAAARRRRTIHLQVANTPCARAAAACRAFVARDGVFAIWTLERVLAALDDVVDTKNLRTRYG
jgi:hypothetical protein